MEQIINTLRKVGPGFEYLVLGVCIVACIVLGVYLLMKLEARTATRSQNHYLKKMIKEETQQTTSKQKTLTEI